VDAVDKEGSTPLHKAAYNGSLECVQKLIEASKEKIFFSLFFSDSFFYYLEANVNAQDKGLCTPLHYAAEMGHKEVCNFLIEKGNRKTHFPR
jgi:ankyrin repeat protein